MSYIAIDTETLGVDKDDYPFMVSLCEPDGTTHLFTWDVDPLKRRPIVSRADIRCIKNMCDGKTLVFHNQNFDVEKLELVGCRLKWRNRSYDTSVLSHLIDSEVHARLKGRLKELALHYLDMPEDDQSDLRKAVSSARRIVKQKYPDWMIAEPTTGSDHIFRDYWLPRAVAKAEGYESDHSWHTVCGEYANGDTTRTMMLFLLFQFAIDKWDKDDPRRRILKREQKITEVLYEMQKSGLHIFPQKINKAIKKYKRLSERSVTRMRSILKDPTFNVDSTIHLCEALYTKLGMEITHRTKSGQPSTDKHARAQLLEIAHMVRNPTKKDMKRMRFIQSCSDYKTAANMLKSIIQYDHARFDDIIYPSLLQNGTSTTRMSSRHPNGQNIKKADEEKGIEGLRNLFGPSGGRIWLCMDYSQLQLRIFAYITEEESMIQAFKDGYDFHGFIASKIFKKSPEQVTKSERRIGKNVNFGFIFGAQPAKIESTSGVPGLWNTVTRMFPSAHRYMEATKKHVDKYGYVVTPHGYRLYCGSSHKGVNYIVQGCEGDIVKEGMVKTHRYLKKNRSSDARLVFQVHDELIFDAPSNMDKSHATNLKKLMESPARKIGMVTPVDIEFTTTNWERTKEWK